MQVRRVKLPELKKARAEGKMVYFNQVHLVIKDRRMRSDVPQGVSHSDSRRHLLALAGSGGGGGTVSGASTALVLL